MTLCKFLLFLMKYLWWYNSKAGISQQQQWIPGLWKRRMRCISDRRWLTLSSFISPSSCTISSLLLSWRADILCSSSSFLCLFKLHERKSEKINFGYFKTTLGIHPSNRVFGFHHSLLLSIEKNGAKHSTMTMKPMYNYQAVHLKSRNLPSAPW